MCEAEIENIEINILGEIHFTDHVSHLQRMRGDIIGVTQYSNMIMISFLLGFNCKEKVSNSWHTRSHDFLGHSSKQALFQTDTEMLKLCLIAGSYLHNEYHIVLISIIKPHDW